MEFPVNFDKALAADSDFMAAVVRLANVGCERLRNMDLASVLKASKSKMPFRVLAGLAAAGADSHEDVDFVNKLASALKASESTGG